MSYWIKNDDKKMVEVNFAVYFNFSFYYKIPSHQYTNYLNCNQIALAQTSAHGGNVWGFFALDSMNQKSFICTSYDVTTDGLKTPSLDAPYVEVYLGSMGNNKFKFTKFIDKTSL